MFIPNARPKENIKRLETGRVIRTIINRIFKSHPDFEKLVKYFKVYDPDRTKIYHIMNLKVMNIFFRYAYHVDYKKAYKR